MKQDNQPVPELISRTRKDDNYNVITHETVDTIHYTNVNKKPQKRVKLKHFLEIEYDFLRFIGLVFTFYKRKTGLNDRELQTILYLYPLGIFTEADLKRSQSYFINDRYQWSITDYYMYKLGLITNFYYKRDKEYVKQFYVLTSKAKEICKEMHLHCLGENEEPMDNKHEIYKLSQFRRRNILWSNIKRMDEYKRFKELTPKTKFKIDTLMKDIKTYKAQLKIREKQLGIE